MVNDETGEEEISTGYLSATRHGNAQVETMSKEEWARRQEKKQMKRKNPFSLDDFREPPRKRRNWNQLSDLEKDVLSTTMEFNAGLTEKRNERVRRLQAARQAPPVDLPAYDFQMDVEPGRDKRANIENWGAALQAAKAAERRQNIENWGAALAKPPVVNVRRAVEPKPVPTWSVALWADGRSKVRQSTLFENRGPPQTNWVDLTKRLWSPRDTIPKPTSPNALDLRFTAGRFNGIINAGPLISLLKDPSLMEDDLRLPIRIGLQKGYIDALPLYWAIHESLSEL